MMRWVALVAVVCASPLTAQTNASATIEVELGVEPADVTVGEPFSAAIRVIPPPGIRVEYGDFADRETLQAVDDPRPVVASGPGAIYRLVAWVPGVPLEATVPVRLIGPDGRARVHLVRLRLPIVRSVLPAGSDSIAPRPAKAFLAMPGDRTGLPWWYWAVAILGSLVAAAAALYLLERRDRSDLETSIPPREWALRQLDSLPATPDTPAELLAVYRRGSWTLRSYLERTDARLGSNLTSTELVGELSGTTAENTGSAELASILRTADRVKFSGELPPAEAASEWLRAARDWIATYPAQADSEPTPSRAA